MADSKSQGTVNKSQKQPKGGNTIKRQKASLAKSQKSQTLACMIDHLPTPALSSLDLKALILKFITETPHFDDTLPSTVQFNSHKLGALKLLAEIQASEGELDNEQELLDILSGDIKK